MENNSEFGPTNISKATSLEEVADFWDTHSLADHEDQFEEVEFEVRAKPRYQVVLEPELFTKVQVAAQTRRVSVETLINLWVSERLHQQAAKFMAINH